MKIPNLYIVGAQKAGSTSVHNWLTQHPDIYSNSGLKDTDIFGNSYDSGQWKQKLEERIKDFSGERYLLHSHVNYCMYEKVLLRLKLESNKAKVIFISREPVDRAISAYRYFSRRLVENRSLTEALVYEPVELQEIKELTQSNNNLTYIEHGFYRDQMNRIIDVFGNENVLFIDYKQLKTEPEKMLEEIFNWLDLPHNVSINIEKKNTGGKVKWSFINKFLFQTSPLKSFILFPIKKIFSRVLISKVKEQLYQLNVLKIKKIDTSSVLLEEEEKVVRVYLEDLYRTYNSTYL